MKIGTTCCILLFTINFSIANVWQGDYNIQFQSEVDDFASDCNCTSINGDLTIFGTDIVHLDGLSELTEVTGLLEIKRNPVLSNLSGLNNLIEIGEALNIFNNSGLIDIAGFENLQNITGRYTLEIKGNKKLTKITGFSNLQGVDWIRIHLNPELKHFTLFKKLEAFKLLSLRENESLTSINELDAILSIGDVSFGENNKLQEINGFNKVRTSGGINILKNPSLQTINAFKKLKEISGISICDNDQLNTLNGFYEIEHANNFKLNLPEAMVYLGNFDSLRTVKNYFTSNITHFENLDSVGRMQITPDKFNGDTLTGPSGLKKIGQLEIEDNDSLKCIKGFSSLIQTDRISIKNNSLLNSISGFNQLEVVGSNETDYDRNIAFRPLSISFNEKLKTIEGFNNLKKLNTALKITGNDNLIAMPAFDQLETIVGGCSINLPDLFINQHNFKNLKRIEGRLYTNATNFTNLDYIGYLTITDSTLQNDTLSGFESVKAIGYLQITGIPILKHIKGFSNLEKTSMRIEDNKNLVSIEAFDQLETIEILTNFVETRELTINANTSLQSIIGLENLKSASEIEIRSNPVLNRLPEFRSLVTATKIQISSNVNLQQIKGFNNLENAEKIYLNFNNNLLSIEGFHQLNNLKILKIENRDLRKLDAFTNFIVIGNLELTNNLHLRSLDNFSNVGLISNLLALTGNLQLNACCLINCWVEQEIIYTMTTALENNGDECSGFAAIKNRCEANSCVKNEETLTDLKISRLANETVQFSFFILEDEAIDYKIYNINDQLIRRGTIAGNKGLNTKTITFSEAQKGFHFLQIDNGVRKEIVKFMKL